MLLLVDTAGCDMEEVAEEGGDSTSNPGEAQVFCSCVASANGVIDQQMCKLISRCLNRATACIQGTMSSRSCPPTCSGPLSRPHRHLQAVLAHAQALIAAGVSPADIGIITPYNAQVRQRHADTCPAQTSQGTSPGFATTPLVDSGPAGFVWQVTLLRELRPRPQLERLEISSVDGFQGKCNVCMTLTHRQGHWSLPPSYHKRRNTYVNYASMSVWAMQGARRRRSSSRWCGPMTAAPWASFQTAGLLKRLSLSFPCVVAPLQQPVCRLT